MTDNQKNLNKLGPLAVNNDIQVNENENISLSSDSSVYSSESETQRTINQDAIFRDSLVIARKSTSHVLGKQELIVHTSSGQNYVLSGVGKNARLCRLRSRKEDVVAFRTGQKLSNALYVQEAVARVPVGNGISSDLCLEWLRDAGITVSDPYAFMVRVVFGASRPLDLKHEFSNSQFKIFRKACSIWLKEDASSPRVKNLVREVRKLSADEIRFQGKSDRGHRFFGKYAGLSKHASRLFSATGLDMMFDLIVEILTFREVFHSNKALFCILWIRTLKRLALNPKKVLRDFLFLLGRASEAYDEHPDWSPEVFNFKTGFSNASSGDKKKDERRKFIFEDAVKNYDKPIRKGRKDLFSEASKFLEEKEEEPDFDPNDGEVILQGPPSKDEKYSALGESFPILHLVLAVFKTSTSLCEVHDWNNIKFLLKTARKTYEVGELFKLLQDIFEKSAVRVKAFADSKDPRDLWCAPGYAKYIAQAAVLDERGPNIVKYGKNFVPAKELLADYERLQATELAIEKSQVRPDSTYFSCKLAVKNRISSLRSKINAGEDRMTPFGISFFGVPGTGKSTLIHSLTRSIHQIERPDVEYSASELYCYDVSANHQDGMQDPMVVDLGDLTRAGYSKNDTVDISALMAKMVDKMSFHVNKASLEDKEESFISPRAVTFTSNSDVLEFGAYNPDQSRLLRRFPYAIEVKYPDHVKPEPHEGFDHLSRRYPELEDEMVFVIHRTSESRGNFFLKSKSSEVRTVIGRSTILDWLIKTYKAHVALRGHNDGPECNIGKKVSLHKKKCCSLCNWEPSVDTIEPEVEDDPLDGVETLFELPKSLTADLPDWMATIIEHGDSGVSPEEVAAKITHIDSMADALREVIDISDNDAFVQGNSCMKRPKTPLRSPKRPGFITRTLDEVADRATERLVTKQSRQLTTRLETLVEFCKHYAFFMAKFSLVLYIGYTLVSIVIRSRQVIKFTDVDDDDEDVDEGGLIHVDESVSENQARTADYKIDSDVGKLIDFVDPADLEHPPAQHWEHLSAPGAVFSEKHRDKACLTKKLLTGRLEVFDKKDKFLAYAHFWSSNVVILGYHYGKRASYFMWNNQKILANTDTLVRVVPSSDTALMQIPVIVNAFPIASFWNDSQYPGKNLTLTLDRDADNRVKIVNTNKVIMTFENRDTKALRGAFEGNWTQNGDCGNCWKAENTRGECVIVGIHLALHVQNGKGFGAFEFLTRTEIDYKANQYLATFQAVLPIFGAQEFEAEKLHSKSKLRFIKGDIGIHVLGTNGKETGFSQGGSKIVVAHQGLHAALNPNFVIPDLQKMTKECGGEWYDTYKHKFDSMNRPLKKVNVEVLDTAIKDYFTSGILPVNLKPLSLEDAVFGIPETAYRAIAWNTSSGTNPLTRRDLMGKDGIDPDLKGRIQSIMIAIYKGNFPVFPSKWSLKDEVIKPEKNDKAKYRIFMVTELEHLLLSRMFLLPIVEAMYADLEAWEMRGHFNATSPQFRAMYHRLKDFGPHILLGDFSGMDSSLKATILEKIARGLDYLVERTAYTLFARKMVYTMVMTAAYSIVNCRGDYAVSMIGLDSGKLVTYWINCITCSVLYRVAHYSLYTNLKSAPRFKHLNLLDTGGDDSACATKNPSFTLYHIEGVLKEYGYVYTDSKKRGATQDFSPWSEFEFFKRTPVVHEDGLVYGALDKNSIMKSICFYKGGGHSLESVLSDNIDAAIREMALHGKDEFAKFLEILQGFSDLPSYRVLTYDEIIRRHNKFEMYSGLNPEWEQISGVERQVFPEDG